jgi:hypothetical protein
MHNEDALQMYTGSKISAGKTFFLSSSSGGRFLPLFTADAAFLTLISNSIKLMMIYTRLPHILRVFNGTLTKYTQI